MENLQMFLSRRVPNENVQRERYSLLLKTREFEEKQNKMLMESGNRIARRPTTITNNENHQTDTTDNVDNTTSANNLSSTITGGFKRKQNKNDINYTSPSSKRACIASNTSSAKSMSVDDDLESEEEDNSFRPIHRSELADLVKKTYGIQMGVTTSSSSSSSGRSRSSDSRGGLVDSFFQFLSSVDSRNGDSLVSAYKEFQTHLTKVAASCYLTADSRSVETQTDTTANTITAIDNHFSIPANKRSFDTSRVRPLTAANNADLASVSSTATTASVVARTLSPPSAASVPAKLTRSSAPLASTASSSASTKASSTKEALNRAKQQRLERARLTEEALLRGDPPPVFAKSGSSSLNLSNDAASEAGTVSSRVSSSAGSAIVKLRTSLPSPPPVGVDLPPPVVLITPVEQPLQQQPPKAKERNYVVLPPTPRRPDVDEWEEQQSRDQKTAADRLLHEKPVSTAPVDVISSKNESKVAIPLNRSSSSFSSTSSVADADRRRDEDRFAPPSGLERDRKHSRSGERRSEDRRRPNDIRSSYPASHHTSGHNRTVDSFGRSNDAPRSTYAPDHRGERRSSSSSHRSDDHSYHATTNNNRVHDFTTSNNKPYSHSVNIDRSREGNQHNISYEDRVGGTIHSDMSRSNSSSTTAAVPKPPVSRRIDVSRLTGSYTSSSNNNNMNSNIKIDVTTSSSNNSNNSRFNEALLTSSHSSASSKPLVTVSSSSSATSGRPAAAPSVSVSDRRESHPTSTTTSSASASVRATKPAEQVVLGTDSDGSSSDDMPIQRTAAQQERKDRDDAKRARERAKSQRMLDPDYIEQRRREKEQTKAANKLLARTGQRPVASGRTTAMQRPTGGGVGSGSSSAYQFTRVSEETSSQASTTNSHHSGTSAGMRMPPRAGGSSR